MKQIMTLALSMLLSTSIYASNTLVSCVNISGKYLISKTFYVQYEQKDCESLTERWCSEDGKECSGSSYTWILDGVFRQEGGNPGQWASIIPEDNVLHRTNWLESGTQVNKRSCHWREQSYSKDQQGNLNVSYKLNCMLPNGEYEVVIKNEKWPLIP